MTIPAIITPETLAILKASLTEDLGTEGDITSLATIPAEKTATAVMRARKKGIVCGLDIAAHIFKTVQSERSGNTEIKITFSKEDGDHVDVGSDLMTITGNARTILAAERTALNFMGHLSGIATETNLLANAISHTRAKICCTRKTAPSFRNLEKYAVRCGGGINHRHGLYDGYFIKDNHIAINGDIRRAVKSVLSHKDGLQNNNIDIVVEVDTIAQLQDIIDLPIDIALLDNMPPSLLRQAVQIAGGKFSLEASGGITPDTITEIAETGVDRISVGWITHSAPNFDIGLDIDMR